MYFGPISGPILSLYFEVTTMGGIGKALGKVMDIAKPIVSAINPLAGAALGFIDGLAKGQNPLQAALGGLTSMIPGGGLAGGLLQNFMGGGLGKMFESFGGNNLLQGVLGMVGGNGGNGGGITDLLGGIAKNFGGDGLSGLSDLGKGNLIENAASAMAGLF